jgi:pimeloyl-ACP methyl ester carboxylesterase
MVGGLALGLSGHNGFESYGVPAAVAAQEKAPAPAATIEHGQVYLLRGLANVWSRGMNQLTEKLVAKGVRASAYNHSRWQELVAEAADKYAKDKNFAPIILIGHSLGANASVLMAERLGEAGVPVRLIIAFDSLSRSNAEKVRIPANVEEVLNFYKAKGWGLEMIPGKGFKGKIDNVNLNERRGVGHLNMDKNPELQAQVVSVVLEALGEEPAKAASN